jgi:hypothetical protein
MNTQPRVLSACQAWGAHSATRWFLSHRRRLWPAVWAVFALGCRFGLRMEWPDAVIVSALPAAIYVVLVFTLPWHIPRLRRWYQFSLKELCWAMAVGGPLLAVVFRFPYLWVDWQHYGLRAPSEVSAYVKAVNRAGYGLFSQRAYALSLAQGRLKAWRSLDSRELSVEIETLRQFGLEGSDVVLLFEIMRERAPVDEITWQAIRLSNESAEEHSLSPDIRWPLSLVRPRSSSSAEWGR